MRLITVEQWLERYFDPKARPSPRTLKRWQQNHAEHPYFRKIGGAWRVDEHSWLADGDPLVQRVLEAG